MSSRGFTRRTLTAIAAGMLIAAIMTPVSVATAAPPEPPDPFDPWPSCGEERTDYCIEILVVDGVDQLDTGSPGYQASASILSAPSEFAPGSFNWSVRRTGSSYLSTEDLGVPVTLVIRSGSMVPRFTAAYADSMYQEVTGDAEAGFRVKIAASPTEINWVFDPNCSAGSCGDETTEATVSEVIFSGNTQDMSTWGSESIDRFGGMWIATNAQYYTFPLYQTFPEASWLLTLGNPHLAEGGAPAVGQFSAWLPPGLVDGLGVTVEEAAATGIAATRLDGDASSAMSTAVSVLDGGLYLRMSDIGFSTPQLTFAGSEGAVEEPLSPDAPVDLVGTPVPGGVALEFDPPRFDGGSVVTRYEVEASDDGIAWETVATTSGRRYTVTGQDPGTPRWYRVRAENAAGVGPAGHRIRATAGARTVPAAPSAVRGTARAGRVDLSWTAPSDTGGAAVTAYRIERSIAGGPWTTVVANTASTATSRTVTGLTNGTAHRFRVAAINTVGAGQMSAPTVALTPRTTPDEPIGLTARPGDRRATLRWTAPASDGGAAVTGYRIERRLDNGAWSVVVADTRSTATTRVVTGLRNGRSYGFRVAAITSVGIGEFSRIATARPVDR